MTYLAENENFAKVLPSLLEMQDEMNRVINPDWINAGNDWKLAIAIEAAEGIEHLGWKWWKKQEPNIAEAQMELIDILHFWLSEQIVRFSNINCHLEISKKIMSDNIEVRCTDPKEIFKFFMAYPITGSTVCNLLLAGFRSLDMSISEVVKLYFSKNILNKFRQLNGYKEGTYVKIWVETFEDTPKEDNEVLREIIDQFEGFEDMFATDRLALTDFIMESLNKRYEVVKDILSHGYTYLNKQS